MLWSRIDKNAAKTAISSFTFPLGSERSEWVKWVNEQTSERSGGQEQSEQSGVSEWAVRANEQMDKRVAQSVFLAVFDHSAEVDGLANGNQLPERGSVKLTYLGKNTRCTMGKNNQEARCKNRATHFHLLLCLYHSLSCSTLLALLAPYAELIHSLACSFTHSPAHGTVYMLRCLKLTCFCHIVRRCLFTTTTLRWLIILYSETPL